MQAVIMAGGKGTRLKSLTNNEIPKPMVQVLGKPILEWQIEKLKENNIFDIILIIGHLGNKICDYFGDGKSFGVNIEYIKEEIPLGTAGALYYLKNKIAGKYFFLIFGDLIFNIDIEKMENFHICNNSCVTLFVHPNSHPFDSDIVITDNANHVIKFDSKNNVRNYWYNNCVNAGIYIVNKSVCENIKKPEKIDFEKDILMVMVKENASVFAYSSPEYVKDVGTVDRILKASKEIKSGFVNSRNLKNKQKCIFLDRDGTLNKHNGLIYKEEDFILEDCTTEAVKLINESSYLSIVITNQPAVARGLCSIDDINNIHNKLKTILGNEGVYLDDIIFCPHHPHKGYPEENPDYKIKCTCRKPDTGMIDLCVKKYNIDVKNSWIIGDTTMDIQTGKNAGLKTILVKTGEGGNDNRFNAEADYVCSNVLEAVKFIIRGLKNGL